MKHLGDITKISGYEVPIVDVVTGGSPCQDLSVAGKRAGLAGERSGLFMEQIRIIKEMREHDRNMRPDVDLRLLRPRYMVWENVPGAFSSNGGEDFRAVLEETAKVAERDACIPRFEGKWPHAGCIMGDGWSIAWRLHDAQFWGVPQRRKRIALVADFGGESAPEILFERKGVSGDSETSREERQGTAESSEGSADPSSYTLKIRGGVDIDSRGKRAGKGALIQTELSATLGVSQDQTLIAFEPGAASRVGGHVYDDVAGTVMANAGDNQQDVAYGIDQQGGKGMVGYAEDASPTMASDSHGTPHAVCYCISPYASNAMKSDNPHSGIYEAETSRTLDLNGGSPACNQGGMVVAEPHCIGNGQLEQLKLSDKVGALNCMHDQQAVITYGLDRASFNRGMNAKYDFSVEEELAQTIVARGPGGY